MSRPADRRARRRGAGLAALLAGACLCLGLATISESAVGAAQRERSWVADYLHGQRQVRQIVELPLTGLAGVRLWLPRPALPGAGRISLRLRSLEDGAELGRAQVAVAALDPARPTLFRIGPADGPAPPPRRPVAAELILEAEQVDRASAVSVMAGPNRYGGGLLLRGGRQIPRADLAFEVLYDTRWFDRILPITRIAWGRPGVLGWPPLYALLAWLIVWGNGWLLLTLARSLGPGLARARRRQVE